MPIRMQCVYRRGIVVDPMPSTRDLNPFRFSGPLAPENMIDRDPESEELLALADGGHSFRLVGPRRYGKTTLLRRVLEAAEQEQVATVLVDLQDVLSIGETTGSKDRSGATSTTSCAVGTSVWRLAGVASRPRFNAIRASTLNLCCYACSRCRPLYSKRTERSA